MDSSENDKHEVELLAASSWDVNVTWIHGILVEFAYLQRKKNAFYLCFSWGKSNEDRANQCKGFLSVMGTFIS